MNAVHRIYYWLADPFRLLVAALMLSSGVLHATDPFGFSVAINRYELTGFRLSVYLATFLPLTQISIGTFLLLRIWVAPSLLIATLMFLAFTFAGGFALSRNLGISCGCFGAFSPNLNAAHVVATSGLALMCGMGCVNFIWRNNQEATE